MGDAGFARFHGCLDPRAEEFRPTYPYSYNQTPLFQPQIYYPYLLPPPPLPYSPLAPTAYVSPSAATPPLPPTLPPASTAATRTLLISSVPADVSESEVRRELEIFGDVRAVQMERVRDGIVTVHFYDLRDAQAAAGEIREQHMQQQSRMRRHFDAVLAQNWGILVKSLVPPPLPPPAAPGLICGHAVWAQFIVPNATCVPDGYNQGTLVIFNLDTNFSTAKLKECFEAFGDVKELRETPMKRHQRFLEFYDIRNAAKAYLEMNGKEIDGNRIAIEFSRPGGHNRKHFGKGSQVQLGVSKKINSATSSPGGQRNYCSQFSPFPRDNLLNSQGKKPSFSRGSSNVIGGARNEGEKCFQKRNCKKEKQVIFGNNNQQQQLQQVMMHKSKGSLKGRGSKCLDPRFLINEVGIMDSNINDSRTTVMIKNIPNKYSQKLLLNMLDNHCIHCNEQIAGGGGDDDQQSPLSSYDFVYLPIDFINKCNVGYGFVNMTSPQAAWRLYKAFHHQNWEVFNSKKICEVTYARLQGLETLKEHFRNSRFPCEAEEYLPVVFSPPRDGRQLSEPLPIVGRMIAASSKTSDDDESSDPAVLLLIRGDNDDDASCINDENGGDGSSNGGDGEEAE